MEFVQYDNPTSFGTDALDLLQENEVHNNLMIGFISNERRLDTTDWFMATVKDASGNIVLTAACTPPFNVVLYETNNQPDNEALLLLSRELKSIGFKVPGVLAEKGLARRFANLHAGENRYDLHLALNIMRLDQVAKIKKAPGHCRPLRESDLFFAPYWERMFGEECGVKYYDLNVHTEKVRSRIPKKTHYIWEDGIPVSQAVHGRSTAHGAVLNGVYTPPHYRGKGYASSVVVELSQSLLDSGYKFCCLYADAKNLVSCGIYRKIGYVDQCLVEELKFLSLEHA